MTIIGKRLLFATLGAVMILMAAQSVRTYMYQRKMQLRQEDVRTLTSIYLRDPKILTMDELFKAVAADGKRLHNPIPKDKSMPCYRLVSPEGILPRRIDSIVNVSQRLIEETNVLDQVRVVFSYEDGSVGMLYRRDITRYTH